MSTTPKRVWVFFPKGDPDSAYLVTADEAVAKDWDVDPRHVHEFMRRCPSRSGPLRCERPVHGPKRMHWATCGTGVAEWARSDPKTTKTKKMTKTTKKRNR